MLAQIMDFQIKASVKQNYVHVCLNLWGSLTYILAHISLTL